MKTSIAPAYADLPKVAEADAILRSCVHCGFCTATCPTYLELRDERDSPRGRIYLIKQLLEGGDVSERTRTHLDRCLTCRACETTCPSGVAYGRLIDIARGLMEVDMPRPALPRVQRWLLRKVLPRPRLFGLLLALGRKARPLVPASLRAKIPPQQPPLAWPIVEPARRMLVLDGCAQKAATPNTNIAAARVLSRLGISLVVAPKAGCCGAVSTHLGAPGDGSKQMRRNIDAWWPYIEAGVEAIVVAASGCGVMIKEYGHLLQDDPAYADKARRVSELTADLSEILLREDLAPLKPKPRSDRIAVHVPCTLQHGMGLPDSVETIFAKAGFNLATTSERHICCGSAGTYSILQPELSQCLLARKLQHLEGDAPDVIVTANIGCQLHLQTGTKTPVRHWIELLDEATARA
jgi:glycolate oxidase iron-sulfur subunit